MPRILLNLTDDTMRRVFATEDFTRLESIGETVRFDPKNDNPETFAALLADCDAALSCWGSRPFTEAEVSGRAVPLLVAHAAGSVRGVVAKSVLEGGQVRLSQGAAAMVPAVAQLTLGLMIAGLRQLNYRHLRLADGTRNYNEVEAYRDLTGLTVGLVGLSRVGAKVAELLPVFEVGRILAYDPYCAKERAEALGVTLTDIDTLIAQSKVVSLHAPVTPETQNLIHAKRVANLRKGSVLVNTARSQIIDQEALFARAIQGELQVYTDVTHPEPLPPAHPAWQSPHIYITPHIAGPTAQTLRRMAQISIGEITRYLNGESLQHEVTAERYDLLA